MASKPEVEQVRPYSTDGEKGSEVEQMFDNIASAYDRMNAAMTAGLHRRWRDRALAMAGTESGAEWLDVATGTGDVAFALLRRYDPKRVEGIDLSSGMLDVARRKLRRLAPEMQQRVSFREANCLALPHSDNSFDVVTVAYGVRNFQNLLQGYREMLRVLRPGGRLVVIELSQPRQPMLRALYNTYSRWIIPIVGRMVSGDPRAYTYLPESIAAAPQRDDMTRLMAEAGFANPEWRQLTLGAVCIYTASKP